MNARRRLKYWIYNSCPGLAGCFPYYGTKVYFPPGAMLFRALCEEGGFETDVIDRLIRLARPHTTVLDVGANIGLMAIPVLRSCPTCHVVSYEPSPNSLPFLQRTIGESIYRDRWIAVERALSSQVGETDFVIGRPGNAAFEGFRSGERISGGRVIRVQVSTLDDEWRRLGQPDVSVVKIDVEGAEGLVLDGGFELFKACRPDVVIEWHEPYLTHFGTCPGRLQLFAEQFEYKIYTVPGGVPVEEQRTLRVQMMTCQNFMLLH